MVRSGVVVAEKEGLDYRARIHREGAWYIAQAIGVDVASQGRSEREALANLREALQLYFTSGAREAL